MKTFVAIDYHKSYSYGTIVDRSGQVLRRGRLANDPEALREFLGEHGGDGCHAVLEAATRNWTLMHDWLERQVQQVTLAHPLKVRAIAEARIKTDKIDAATLAHLLRCDLIPKAHVPSKDARVIKNLLRQADVPGAGADDDQEPHRRAAGPAPAVAERPSRRPDAERYGTADRAWLKRLPLPAPDRRILRNELGLLEQLRGRIRQAERWVDARRPRPTSACGG